MSLSLRQRVLLLLLAINVAVVSAEVMYLAREQARRSAESTERQALGLLRGLVVPGAVNVVHILRWPEWSVMSDALIADRSVGESAGGQLRPQGVALNPLGSEHRPADFDYEAVYGAIGLAVAAAEPIEDVAGGRVVPIASDRGGVWGGLWYRYRPAIDVSGLIVNAFLPIFLVSTLLLSLVTFVVLRRLVVEPVEELAAAARRVAAGDLEARVQEPARRDELTELVRAFNAMTLEVRQAEARLEREVREATAHARRAEAAAMTQRRLAATGELAAGIAHEINNPLGGLQNAARALARPELPEGKRARYLELLEGGLERIRATVEKLLRFTPRGAGASSLRAVNPARPVLDALALVRHRAREEGVALALELAGRRTVLPPDGARPAELERELGALPTVIVEEGELGQAVLNLLVNALDALASEPDRARAGVGARAPRVVVGLEFREAGGGGRDLVVSVSDNGPGIPRDELDRVRDLFYTTKEVGKGSGLGLAMVHNVAEAHGGELRLENLPPARDGGLRAVLVLPDAPRPSGAAEAEPGGGGDQA